MKRVRIDRLDIHLRNVPADAAQEAGRLLGPALARALRDRTVNAAGGTSVEAGRVSVDDSGADALARTIARRVADTTSVDSRSGE